VLQVPCKQACTSNLPPDLTSCAEPLNRTVSTEEASVSSTISSIVPVLVLEVQRVLWTVKPGISVVHSLGDSTRTRKREREV
jgi:hypothetical protein